VVFSLLGVRYQHGKSHIALNIQLHSLPSMRYTNYMPHITQAEFQQLIRHDTRRITETKQAVIGEHGSQTHRPSVQ